jgi:hypothetical protein
MSARTLVLAAALLAVGAPRAGLAQERTTSTQTSAGGEGWFGEADGFHGWAAARVWHRGPRGEVGLDYNTDALELGGLARPGARVAIGGAIRGQYGYAGLLRDLYVDGRAYTPDLDIVASSVGAGVDTWFWLGRGVTLGVRGRIDRYFVTGDDHIDLVDTGGLGAIRPFLLPPDALVAGGSLALSWVSARASDELRADHPFARAAGLRLYAQGGPAWSDEAQRDGAGRESCTAEPRLSQCDARTGLLSHVTFVAGRTLGRFRISGRIDGRYTRDATEAQRALVGGSVPFYVAAPGLPWGVIRADSAIGGVLDARWRSRGAVEVGPFVGATVSRNAARGQEAETRGGTVSAGALVDARFRGFFVRGSVGVAPVTPWSQRAPSTSILLAGGWAGTRVHR